MYMEDLDPKGRFLKSMTTGWLNFFKKLDRSVYKEARFEISDTTVADHVGYPVPVLESGPAIDLTVVMKLVPTSGLELVFKRNTVRIGSIWVPANTSAYTVVTQGTFEAKNLQLKENDVLTMDITQSDGTVNAGGVAVAVLRWIAV